MRARFSLALLLAAAMAFAGCAGGGGTLGSDAGVTFDGNTSGSHGDSADCGDQGTVSGSGTVNDGSLEVRVTDGSGDEVFQETFEGEISMDAQTVDGASGNWKIEATRSGDDLAGDEFQGEYTFRLDC
jgi:hypothetical protein